VLEIHAVSEKSKRVEQLTLNGQWELYRVGETESIPATVPGCVHTDLLAAKKIEDPYYRDSEHQVMWIGENDWMYRRVFTVPADLLAQDRVLLRCDGLDTLATIKLNGQDIGQSDNMFRVWEFDVKDSLQPGENILEIRFDSPVRYVRSKTAERRLPQWGGGHTIQGGPWLRKEPCNYGWDWGPMLATSGIWRDVTIVAFTTARIDDLHILQDHTNPDHVTLQIKAAIERTRQVEVRAKASVSFGSQVIAERNMNLDDSSAEVELAVFSPQLWWPNGMGKQRSLFVWICLTPVADCSILRRSALACRLCGSNVTTMNGASRFTFPPMGPFFRRELVPAIRLLPPDSAMPCWKAPPPT
jgi:beta-mannosidase